MLAAGCGGEFVLFGTGDGSETGAAGGGGATGTTSTTGTTGTTSTTGSAGGAGTTSEVSATATGSGAGGAGGMGQGGDPAPPCHPPGLVDTFEGNAVDLSLWNLQGEDSIISVNGGLLHITPTDGAANGQWAGMVTTDAYDLTQCSVWIMVPSLIKDGFSYFQLYTDTGKASFEADSGQLVLTIGTQETTVPYSMSSQLWWRIREGSGTLFLETSPDANNWTVVHSAPTPPWINDVAIGLGTVSPTNATQLGETQWDNLNALP